MNLICRINEKEYKNIVVGNSFSEEYNETLDSGSIIISHVEKMHDLKPYTDVFIWDAKYYFKGYDKNGVNQFYTDETYTTKIDDETAKGIFYKHLLVNNFTETMINLRDFKESKKEIGVGEYTPIYEYKIQLFSETKGLEVIQLPNISITEPLNSRTKITIWEYLNRYINLYSPKYKSAIQGYNANVWQFERKYKVSPSLMKYFDDCFPQDFSLNSPNLRKVLEELMKTKDMIPYVYNDIIYALDITERMGNFTGLEYVNYISGSMTSNDYYNNLKTTYSNGMSQDNMAKTIEYIGFRNNDNSLMTLGNMRLETRFPIYKINKLHMCYFKKIKAKFTNGEEKTYIFLCKQDITPLIKLETERNALSKDWQKFQNLDKLSATIQDLADYKMATVGYNIGSKYIKGWGEQYQTPIEGTFWDQTHTYIENIINLMDVYISPFGIDKYQKVKTKIKESDKDYWEGKDAYLTTFATNDFRTGMVTPFGNANSSPSLMLKSFIFEVDYQAFYNGSVLHSKDGDANMDITVNDSPSSSLSLLEHDGLAKKEKINRYGNKSITINARYDDISQLQPLGSVLSLDGDDDIVIYHREYQIWNNHIDCVYYGSHDYVLKNFYTSVFAKHRTWSLIPYSESVRRAENRKLFLLLSKKRLLFEKPRNFLEFTNFENIYRMMLSCFETNNEEDKINYAYIYYDGQKYATDLNIFVSGLSLCFNLCMPDNISAGNYIESISFEKNNKYNEITNYKDSDIWKTVSKYLFMKDVGDDYTGSKQNWYPLVDSKETGAVKTMGFYLSHVNDMNIGGLVVEEPKNSTSGSSIIDTLYREVLTKLPKISTSVDTPEKNKLGKTIDIYKDNKEYIDMTYQIEPIVDGKDIMISDWFMKLNNLITGYVKIPDTILGKKSETDLKYDLSVYSTTKHFLYLFERGDLEGSGSIHSYEPLIFLKIKKNFFEYYNDNKEKLDEISFDNASGGSIVVKFERPNDEDGLGYSIDELSVELKNILGIKDNGNLIVNIQEEIVFAENHFGLKTETKIEVRNIDFEKISEWNGKPLPDSEEYQWFRWSAGDSRQSGKIDNLSGDLMKPYMFLCAPNGNKSLYISEIECNKPIFGDFTATETLFDFEESRSIKYFPSFVSISGKLFDNTFYRNQRIILSSEYLNKDLIYNSFLFADDFSEFNLYKVGEIVKYDNKIYECRREITIPHEFKEGEWNNLKDVIAIRGNVYKKSNEFNSDYHNNLSWIMNSEKIINECFQIKTEDMMSYIYVDLTDIDRNTKSIQYWYNNNGELEFVFGVNITDEDWRNNYIKIYISLTSSRDTKVYDTNHRLVGETKNYADSHSSFGWEQMYTPLENKEQ